MSLEARKMIYEQASISVRDKHARKVKVQALDEKVSEKGLVLIKLINIIPLWETYLSEKQLEAVREYKHSMSITEVGHRLKIDPSSADCRLFGDPGKSKGALGRLMEVYVTLKKNDVIKG